VDDIVQKYVVKRKAVLVEETVEKAAWERRGGEVGQAIYMRLPTWYDRLTEDSGSCSVTAVMTEKVDVKVDFFMPSQIFHSQSSLWAALTLSKNAVRRYIRTALDGGR
jgi:hypothetical protein